MPEVSLFETPVLTGVVEKLTQPTDFTWLGTVPVKEEPFPVAAWDVIRGSRMVSKPNTPNAEAHIVPRMGISRETASFIYTREKKVLEPTTIHWLRQPGTVQNKENAEKAVLREVTDLNQRVDNLQEWALWQAIQGKIVLDTVDVSAVVDYKMPASHKVKVATPWPNATPQQMVADVTAIKRTIQRDGRVAATEAYADPQTLDLIIAAFASNGASLLSDRAKDSYYGTGTLPGFLQLNWKPVTETYDVEDGSGLTAPYLQTSTIVFANSKTNRPIELAYGPSADDSAPHGHIGKFSKSWKDEDPSARQILIELNFLPLVTRPEQFAVLTTA